MGSLKTEYPGGTELVSQILDEELFWTAIDVVSAFLKKKNAVKVRIRFGFILDRELRGEPQPEEQTVDLADLRDYVRKGLDEGTIEWNGQSDCVLEPSGLNLKIMWCNDADLHFASDDVASVMELGNLLQAAGVNIYRDGQPLGL